MKKSQSQSKSKQKELRSTSKIKQSHPKQSQPVEQESPQQSYLDMIQKAMRDYENQNRNIDAKQLFASEQFNIYEDLQIIVSIASDEKNTKIGTHFFKTLQDKCMKHRQISVMRTRYRDCLRTLQQADFDKIIKYINTDGLNGYLQFESVSEDGEKINRFVDVVQQLSEQDYSKKQQKQTHRQKVQKQNEQYKSEINKEIWQTSKQKAGKRPDKFINEGGYQIYQEVSNNIWAFLKKKIDLRDLEQRIKIEQALNDFKHRKEKQFDEKHSSVDLLKDIANNRGIKYDELKKIVISLSNLYQDKEVDQIITDLDRVSGRVSHFINYVENGSKDYYWTQDRDNILKKVKGTRDKELKKLNLPDKSIVERIRYLERKNKL